MREVFIAPSDAEMTGLRQLRQCLIERLQPAEKPVMVAELRRIANHHASERKPAQWEMLFDDFWEDLQEFSSAHIHEAVVAHRRENNWFPKVHELRSKCVELRDTDQWRLRRTNVQLTGSETGEAPASDKTPAEPVHGFDAGANLRDLAEQMRVKSGATKVSHQVEEVIAPRLNTARPATDAAELLDHLKKRTGT